MKLHKIKADLDALQNNQALFDESQFNARKEALNFIALIEELYTSGDPNAELTKLYEGAQQLGDRILAFNDALFQGLRNEILVGVKGEHLRDLVTPFTNYSPENQGQPHYGYENLDSLIEGVLIPLPHPEPKAEREYGMVRYEPTPVSVILELNDQVQFSRQDVFYDLGSGLGKVIMLVHLLTGVPCIGVEFEPAFYRYAVQRAASLGLTGAKFINTDAREVDYSKGTLFFLFNPFGGRIFNTVVARLEEVAQTRPITICSYGAGTPRLSEIPWLEVADPGTIDEVCLAIFRSTIN
ncbi:MAG: hypothetical protein ISR58_21510 [Anaerolineales bacterium]|nr:hypothetical protein [Chloroflexota bacterium]MBL6983769.1 hypothetical protein [Anaerolineales bacterium]